MGSFNPMVFFSSKMNLPKGRVSSQLSILFNLARISLALALLLCPMRGCLFTQQVRRLVSALLIFTSGQSLSMLFKVIETMSMLLLCMYTLTLL